LESEFPGKNFFLGEKNFRALKMNQGNLLIKKENGFIVPTSVELVKRVDTFQLKG
jgi:hypothetical protein